MTALLAQQGIKGVQAYSILGGKLAAVEEAKLRAAIAEAGADGMLIARATRVEDASFTIPGRSVANCFRSGVQRQHIEAKPIGHWSSSERG